MKSAFPLLLQSEMVYCCDEYRVKLLNPEGSHGIQEGQTVSPTPQRAGQNSLFISKGYMHFNISKTGCLKDTTEMLQG